MANYNNVGIQVSIEFENKATVEAKLKSLLETIQNNKIHIDLDVKSIGLQLAGMQKQLDKLGIAINSSQSKTSKETIRIYKNENEQVIGMLNERARQLEALGNKQTKVSWFENDKGNIKSAIIEYTDGVGKISQEMYKLRMTSSETENSIIQTFSMKNAGTKFVDNIDKAEKSQNKLNNSVKDFEIKLQRLENRYGKAIPKDELQTFQTALNNLKTGGLDNIEQKTKEINQMFQKLTLSTQETSKSSFGMSGLIGNAFNSLPTFLLAGNLYNKAFSEIRGGITDIINLDSAMTNLRKVTDETDASYTKFLNTAHNTAIALGGSSKNIIDATSEFAKLGYSMKDASKLGENALIYQNVGDIQDITRASASMVSTMSAFNIEAKDSINIIDKFNKIGNEFSISSEGIGLALQKSAAALNNANNDINESIALIASANKIVQNPEEVGSALKTLSLRLRMVKDDSGELEANMRSLVKEISGVDIMLDEDNFKSTYQILLEIGRVWDTLADKERALLGEKIAGKNRANVFFGIMDNWKDLEKVSKASLNSQGSAMEEYSKYMQSLEAKISIFQETLVKLFSTNIENGFIGGIIESGTQTISILNAMTDKFGTLPTVVMVATAAMLLFNKQLREFTFGGEDKDKIFTRLKNGISNFASQISAVKASAEGANKSFLAYGTQLVATKAKTIAMTVATTAMQAALTMGLSIALSLIIQKLSEGIEKWANWKKYASEAIEASSTAISNLSSNIQTINELSDSYDKLSGKIKETKDFHKLSAEEQKEYVDISRQLLEISPDLLYYYDENGNRILSETNNLPELIALKKEELDIEKQRLALNAGKLYSAGNMSISKDKAQLEDMKKRREELERILANPLDSQNSSPYSKGDISSPYMKDKYGVEAQNTVKAYQNRLKELNQEITEMEYSIKQTSRENAQHALSVLNASDAYKELSPSIKNTVSELITLNHESFGAGNIDDVTNKISEYARQLELLFNSDLKGAGLNNAITQLSNDFIETAKSFNMTDGEAKSLANTLTNNVKNSIKTVSDANKELAESNALTEDAIKDMAKNLKDTISEIGSLQSALKELDKEHELSASTISNLIEKYPDLIYVIGDEMATRRELTSIIEDQEQIQRQILEKMIMNDTEYYTRTVENNVKLRTKLSELYGIDFTEFKTLAQAKDAVDKKLVEGFAERWSKFYKKAYSMDDYVALMQSMSRSGDPVIKARLAEMEKDYQLLQTQSKKFDDLTFSATDFSKFSGLSYDKSKSSSSKSNLPKYLTQGFDDAMKEIESKGDQLEREIERTQKKILNAQKLGNIQEELELQKQLEEMYAKRIILEKEKSEALLELRSDIVKKLSGEKLNELAGINLESVTEKQFADVKRKLDAEIDKANVAKNDKLVKTLSDRKEMIDDHLGAIIDINKDVNSITTSLLDSENERIEQSIALLERKYELESKISNQKIRDLEYEQMLYEQDTEGYANLERQKLDVIYLERQRAEDMYNQLRQQGYDAESELVQKYHDLWYDYNVKIRQMQMETAKRNKENELKNLREKQTHTEQLISMTMDMLRSQYQEERELIEKNSKAKQDALNKELDSRRKIINEHKKALQDEVKEEDYQSQLDQYNKELSAMKSQAALLGKDETAVVEYEKLLEDIAKKESELKKHQRDYNIELQQESLDKELSQYEDKIKSEIDNLEDQKKDELSIIDKTLKNEVRLREEAIRLIERKNKDLYNQLNKWAEENGTKTKEEIENAWNGAYDAINEYNQGQLDVLDTLTLIADKIKEVENSSWTDWSFD